MCVVYWLVVPGQEALRPHAVTQRQTHSISCYMPQDTVDHTPAGTGNYFSHGSLSKIFFVEFKSESLKNKKVSKFQQL